MKKFIPLFIFIFSIMFVKSADAACVTMNVSLAATGNWPAGESVKISCKGDNPPGPSNCTGASATIKPGETKTLKNCTCPDGGHPDSGCVVVESKPAKCSEPAVRKTNYCGTNGSSVTAKLEAKCEAAPTPTPVCGAAYCENWGSGGNSAPTCVSNGKTYYKAYKECKVDGKVVDYQEQRCGSVSTCEVPTADEPTSTPTSTPVPDAPTNTPTDTPPSNPPPGNPPPGNPPPDNPPPTDVPPTATSVPPTATPTPDPFSEAMCKCNNMTVSQIIAGQNATFTANAKVEGSDTTYAQVKEIEFLLSSGNNPASRTRIAGPQRMPATITSQTANLVQYQSQWTIPIPGNIQKGTDYVAQATVKCSRKTNAYDMPYTATVLSASTEQRGFFGAILEFFANIFNRTPVEQQVPTPTPTVREEFATIAEGNLQLDSFAPATVTEKTCNSVKFRF